MNDYTELVNHARALMNEGRFEESELTYARAVALDPTAPAGQWGLAQIRYMRGDPMFARDLATAAARDRTNIVLHQLFANLLRQVGDLDGAELVLRDLIARVGPRPALRSSLATVLHEAGKLQDAYTEALAAAGSREADANIAQTFIAVMLSLGRADEAMPVIREARNAVPQDLSWIAFEATAARLLGDPAYETLYDYDELVRVYDLEAPTEWRSIEELNTALETTLTTRHQLSRQPLGQTLRSGTQTPGSLTDDADPAIQAILQAFAGPIADYRASLADTASTHPLASRNRGESLIVGCWSVRLHHNGYHVNHIHPQGWLSSAYYVSVPSECDDETHQRGWIKFGEPAFEVPGAEAARTIQPRPGRLVLFPSYMWHGTRPIESAQPRLTMAFDVITGTS